MAYKTILVCLNDVARLDVLIKLASDIAAKQNAHVIGLYVLPAVRIYPAVGPGMFAQVVEEYRETFKARSTEVRQRFEGYMRKQTFQSEWRFVDSKSPDIADVFIEHGFQAVWVMWSWFVLRGERRGSAALHRRETGARPGGGGRVGEPTRQGRLDNAFG